MAMDPNTQRMLKLFFGYELKRATQLKDGNRLLAHYTTADTAMKIITGKKLWLRNAGVMNDFMEIDYGRNVVDHVIGGKTDPIPVARFHAALDAIHPDLSQAVMKNYVEARTNVRESVFMSSLGEYEADDRFGKLSMWRAYGGPVSGVALLFKNSVLDLEVEPPLAVSLTPVLYGNERNFLAELLDLAERLENEKDFLQTFDTDSLTSACGAMLQFAIASIKHPGFREEEEWRLIHRPYMFSSTHVINENITLNGIPQAVYKLPFHNPSEGELFNFPQLDLNEILEGIVIGPCLYPETILRSFLDAMGLAGIENPRDRIRVSGIPLRQQW